MSIIIFIRIFVSLYYTGYGSFCKMEDEYALKISLTKHEHDNPEKPYYWSLMKYDSSWHQTALGWEESPEKCFFAAIEFFENSI